LLQLQTAPASHKYHRFSLQQFANFTPKKKHTGESGGIVFLLAQKLCVWTKGDDDLINYFVM